MLVIGPTKTRRKLHLFHSPGGGLLRGRQRPEGDGGAQGSARGCAGALPLHFVECEVGAGGAFEVRLIEPDQHRVLEPEAVPDVDLEHLPHLTIPVRVGADDLHQLPPLRLRRSVHFSRLRRHRRVWRRTRHGRRVLCPWEGDGPGARVEAGARRPEGPHGGAHHQDAAAGDEAIGHCTPQPGPLADRRLWLRQQEAILHGH
mmetsp:Transcript_97622/g.164272  ORF Transcript_97622/g.164272 Transcript_97622/m.164272 type:complete len:202 (-) Transcript_97622:24-629(-)